MSRCRSLYSENRVFAQKKIKNKKTYGEDAAVYRQTADCVVRVSCKVDFRALLVHATMPRGFYFYFFIFRSSDCTQIKLEMKSIRLP